MVTASRSATAEESPAQQRYRAAEQALWRAYDLAPTERWLELRDPSVRLRVLEVGSGRPLLMVPGTGGTGPYWAPLARELRGFRCLMIDRPGWGLSSPVDYAREPYAALVSRLLAGVLHELDLERTDVVGASIGGLWALRLAQAAPDRVGRVVVLGGIPNREVELPTVIKLLRSPLGALMVRVPMRRGMLRKQLQALGHGATLARGAMEDFIAWRLAFQRDTPSMRHERDMVRGITQPGGFRPGVTFDQGELASVAAPTLVVFGAGDPTGNPEIWRRFADELPNGELQVLADAGHQPWWDAPAAVGERVRDFLTG
jgi:pimeloyl-ACP methyl ester carboxylesterase